MLLKAFSSRLICGIGVSATLFDLRLLKCAYFCITQNSIEKFCIIKEKMNIFRNRLCLSEEIALNVSEERE